MGYASKVPQHQQMYLRMLALGLDRSSHLYQDGKQRSGQGHLGAFWDGYNGVKNSAHVLPSTLSEACAAAGVELRSRDEHAGTVVAEWMATGEQPSSRAPAQIDQRRFSGANAAGPSWRRTRFGATSSVYGPTSARRRNSSPSAETTGSAEC